MEKVFPSKPQEAEAVKYVYKTHEDTPEQLKAAAEEKAAKEALTPAEQEQKAKEEALSFNKNKKRKEGKNYFAVQVGPFKSDLQVDLTDLGGPADLEISGTNVGFGIAYMRKFTDRLWYGGAISFGMFSKNNAIYPYGANANDRRDTEVTGQVYDLNALFNFYLNPKNPLRVYLTGGVGVSSVGLSKSYSDFLEDPNNAGVWKWGPIEKKDATFTALNGNFGVGLEWAVDDINIGLETRFKYMPLKDELEKSSKNSILVTLKASWFF